MSNDKCPKCGAEKIEEVKRYLSPCVARSIVFACGRHVKTDWGTEDDNSDSENCDIRCELAEVKKKNKSLEYSIMKYLDVFDSYSKCDSIFSLIEETKELRKAVEG